MERHPYGSKTYEISVHLDGYVRKQKIPINFGGNISWKAVEAFEAPIGKIIAIFFLKVLLTVHLSIILVTDQLNAPILVL